MALQTKVVSTGDYAWQSWSNGYGITLTLTQESTDIAANTSKVSYLFTISNTDNNRFTSNDYSWTIYIGGQSISISHFNFALGANYTTQTMASGQITVPHNADGTLDMPYEVSIPNVQAWNRYGPPAMTLSGTWALILIPRQATLTAAPNFTDEENPIINYNNPAGEAADALQACICNEKETQVYAAYRDIPKTGTSYTFSLTQQERAALRNATAESNSRTVKFVLLSSVGGVTKYSQLTRTLTIVNAQPVLSAEITDGNAATVALTGDADTLIKFYSDAVVTATYAGQKGAYIWNYWVANGAKRGYISPYTFYGAESGVFDFGVTDSRGNSTTASVKKPLVEYVKLTCGLSDNKPDTNGNMTVSVSGCCFNGSFGAVNNTLTVYYRYKVSGGSYGDWVKMTPVLSGNTYHAQVALTGFDYQTAYTFQARAVDRLAEVSSTEYTVRALPVFDWGEQDFNVNGTFKINNMSVADHVVEQGTSEDWVFRKWASGIAECWTEITDPKDLFDWGIIEFPFPLRANPVLHASFDMSRVEQPILTVPLYVGLGFEPLIDDETESVDLTIVTAANYIVWGISPASQTEGVEIPKGVTMQVYLTGRWK